MAERVSRRQVMTAVGAGLLGTATGRAGADQNSQESDVIEMNGTVTMDWEAEAMQYTVAFDLPSQVTELTIAYASLSLSHRSVGEMQNLEESDGTYVWDGGEDPVIRLDTDLTSSEFPATGVGYFGDETALMSLPHHSLSWRYTGTSSPEVVKGQNTFDSDGYATEELAFAGANQSHSRTVSGTELTFVVPDAVERSIDEEAALDFVELGETAIGGVRYDHDRKGLFLIPDGNLDGIYSGRAVGNSFLVLESTWGFDRIGNVLAHEFSHTVFGGFGTEGMLWLDEAIAEYYGYLIALTAGLGDTDAFFEAAQTKDQFADAVLSNPDEVRGSRADYHKGAHVLAALDGTIRQRTDSDASLIGIFRTDEDLNTYEGFRAAVTEITDDPSMGEWADEYVQTEALPEIPRDPDLYSLPDIEREEFQTPDASSPAADAETGPSTSSSSTPEITFDEVGPGFTPLGGLAGVAGLVYLLGRRNDEN